MRAVTLRIDEDSNTASERIQKKTKLKQSDILRLAIERGLPLVEEAFFKFLPSKKGPSE